MEGVGQDEDEEMAYPNIAKRCTWAGRTVTNWVTLRDLPREVLAGELLQY